MREGPTQTTPAPAHILLVDDNRLGLAARKSVLEEQGYRITTAPDGEQALELYTGGSFDLLITDYKMPKLDGLALIKRIRGLRAQAPIILISGYAEALGMTEANTGADAVIAKGANEVTHLVRAVNRLLRRPAPKKPMRSQRSQVKVRRQGAQ